MKKCPYCFTLMNNDVNTCPKCLKDMRNVSKMKEVAPKDNKISYYSLCFGLIISLGSVVAALSIRDNKNNYIKQYEEIYKQYSSETVESVKESLKNQCFSIKSNITSCQFREIAFYVMCGIGVALVLYALISFLVKKYKKRKNNIAKL